MKSTLLLRLDVAQDGRHCGECVYLVRSHERAAECALLRTRERPWLPLEVTARGALRAASCLALELRK